MLLSVDEYAVFWHPVPVVPLEDVDRFDWRWVENCRRSRTADGMGTSDERSALSIVWSSLDWVVDEGFLARWLSTVEVVMDELAVAVDVGRAWRG